MYFPLSPISSQPLHQECEQSFSTLKCIAPPLEADLFGPYTSLVPGVNYTIIMGDTPGPSFVNLTIEVDFDTFFVDINPDDQTQIVGSVKTIRINVCGLYIHIQLNNLPCARVFT